MREVGEKLIDKAIENGYNVILERTLSSTDTVSKQLDKFKENGYELNLYVVTCNKNHSISSAEQRYLNGKIGYEKGIFADPPRKISKEFQKECYENLGKSTQTLAQKYDFVWNRDNGDITYTDGSNRYENMKEMGEHWKY